MLGDDMAILSGGMYGNPESAYTTAIPGSVSSAGSFASAAGIGLKTVGAGLKMFGALKEYGANEKQIKANINALKEEKAYNIENYQQYIADQLASNKFSFYSSGLDINTGTARSVIESNKAASTADMNMMIRQYDTELKTLKEKRKANETNLMFNMANTVIGSFI